MGAFLPGNAEDFSGRSRHGRLCVELGRIYEPGNGPMTQEAGRSGALSLG